MSSSSDDHTASLDSVVDQEDVGEEIWTAEPLNRKQTSPSLWGRNVAKKRRDSGLEYLSDKTRKLSKLGVLVLPVAAPRNAMMLLVRKM